MWPNASFPGLHPDFISQRHCGLVSQERQEGLLILTEVVLYWVVFFKLEFPVIGTAQAWTAR